MDGELRLGLIKRALGVLYLDAQCGHDFHGINRGMILREDLSLLTGRTGCGHAQATEVCNFFSNRHHCWSGNLTGIRSIMGVGSCLFEFVYVLRIECLTFNYSGTML